MRRLALVAALFGLLAGCSTTLLARGDVDDVVEDAFRAAGLEADDIAVGRTREEGLWPASATVSGTEVDVRIDPSAGRITSIDLGESDVISDAELTAIAGYASNPADDRARTRRRAVTLVVVISLVGAGLLVARRARLREEQALSAADMDE